MKRAGGVRLEDGRDEVDEQRMLNHAGLGGCMNGVLRWVWVDGSDGSGVDVG